MLTVGTILLKQGVNKMQIRQVVLGFMCMSLFVSFSYKVEASQTLYSKGAVLIEQDSKRILYDRNAQKPLPMASTTKIMTCLLALEKGNLNDVVTISSRAARAPKVKLNLKVGEKQFLGDLLYSLMLESHNDTAIAIAEHIGGTVENFCNMMTARGKELGAVATSFETPNGLDSTNHYTTPYDLAVITAVALENPQFIEIINTPYKSIPSTALEGSVKHELQNKNRFLSLFKGANGVKTGYTSKAGHCFVGAVEKDNMQLIGVALGAGWDSKGKTRKYTDVVKLMEYGFDNYAKYKVVDPKDSFPSLKVEKGKASTVDLYCPDTVILPLTQEEVQTIALQITLPEGIQAPVTKDDAVGSVAIICDGKVLKRCELLTVEGMEKETLMDYIKRLFSAIKK